MPPVGPGDGCCYNGYEEGLQLSLMHLNCSPDTAVYTNPP